MGLEGLEKGTDYQCLIPTGSGGGGRSQSEDERGPEGAREQSPQFTPNQHP